MSDTIRYILAAVFISAGLIFALIGVIGTFRFRYVLNRMHAAAILDTFSLLFVVAGLIIITGFTFTSLKLIAIIVFFWFASPVTSHLISNLIYQVDKDRVKKESDVEIPEDN